MPPRTTSIAVASAITVVAFAAAADPAAAQSADTYAGKTVTVSVPVGPGGGHDLYMRMLARNLGRFLPGAPTMVVVNQPGGGGLLALNHMAKIAPQDGTWIGMVSQSLLIHEVTGQPGMQVSLGKLGWVGNMTQTNPLVVTWHTSKVRNIEEARQTEALFGSSGVGATASQVPNAVNVVLGTRFKVVLGYKGTGDTDLAIQRGELDGRVVSSWSSYRAALPDEVRDKLNILVQIGKRKAQDVPQSVPLLLDLVKGNAEKEPIALFLTLVYTMNRPIATGPGVPPERLAILRKAFDETMIDKTFLADAEKIKAEIEPMGGAEVERGVTDILALPKSTIEAVRGALGG